MTETMRDWLIGIIAAAMLMAVVGGFTPSGTIQKIGKMTGGLVLMLAMLRPVAGVDLTTMSGALTEYRVQAGIYEDAVDETNGALLKTIIEERTGAYILEQASAAGIMCDIDVLCRLAEDGVPYPYEVKVTGSLTEAELSKLLTMLEADLAIAPERVYVITKEAVS